MSILGQLLSLIKGLDGSHLSLSSVFSSGSLKVGLFFLFPDVSRLIA